ncbi:cc-nbs-lrr resistance protein [Corchorus olitorius]|uniref:Cc-nbs-lrr resistance protein n=1 Tax=Corchorus olitorius TaxID=93759 RepID=A0A1R3H832_9ROSI|nr:cc-nbs-lrr resistance protein [Corchorus olitorius]
MGLNNVVEASEASEARLSTKAGLRELVLNFFVSNEEVEVRDGEKEAVVVEALQPPPCLQRLEIRFSNSSTSLFPSWMTSLTMLKTLEFDHCSKWESLPPLGSLPSLESLYIFSLEKVKKVGEEFLGVERGVSSTNIIAFPNLQILELTRMDGLEDWEYGNQFSNNTSSSGGVTIMPRLEHLRIWRCPKLKTLPHHLFHHLQKLKIEDCPLLSSRFEEGEGEDWHYISHIPDIHIPQERKGYDWHGISHIPDLNVGGGLSLQSLFEIVEEYREQA